MTALLLRRFLFLTVCLMVLAVPGQLWLNPAQLLAQEPAAEEGAAPAAAEGEAAEEEEGGSEHGGQQSTLMWIIHTSGVIGGVLFAMSIYFVAMVVQLFLELRTEVVAPAALTEEWENQLAKRDYNSIYKTAKESSSQLGQLVAAGMTGLSGGLGEARESIDRLGEAIIVEMEKRISMLAVIGSLGPLIGLLGTLKGMIASFAVIATSDQQLKASEVAGGISEALLITFEGVALSVPAIYFFAFFKNRVSSLSVTAINDAEELVRRVYTSAQQKPAGAAAAPAAPAAS